MTFTIYQVFSAFDRDTKLEASFGTRLGAEQFRDQICSPGSMSSAHVETEKVYDSYIDYCKNNPRTLRENVLKKLTKEDKEILGIQD